MSEDPGYTHDPTAGEGTGEGEGAAPGTPPSADVPEIPSVTSIIGEAQKAAHSIIDIIIRDLVGSRSVSPTNELILALVDYPAMNAYMREMGRKT